VKRVESIVAILVLAFRGPGIYTNNRELELDLGAQARIICRLGIGYYCIYRL